MANNQYPLKVKPKLCLIEKWKRYDLTDEEICNRLKIKKSSFYSYKRKYPELEQALRKGKDETNAEVENALLKSSLGYEYVEESVATRKEVIYENGKRVSEISEPVKISLKKFKPSETAAAKLWLTNRDAENWKEKNQLDIGNSSNEPIRVVFSKEVEEASK